MSETGRVCSCAARTEPHHKGETPCLYAEQRPSPLEVLNRHFAEQPWAEHAIMPVITPQGALDALAAAGYLLMCRNCKVSYYPTHGETCKAPSE